MGRARQALHWMELLCSTEPDIISITTRSEPIAHEATIGVAVPNIVRSSLKLTHIHLSSNCDIFAQHIAMGFIGTVLNTVGALFLTHAVYSTHEHTATFAEAPLPLDITIELLASIALLSVGIVLSFAPFKPIQHAEWAGQISREGRKSEGEYTREGEEILTEGDPYAFLGLDGGIGGKSEGRRGFWDVKGKRKEYEDWVRSGGNK